jgi:hypothetical protein
MHTTQSCRSAVTEKLPLRQAVSTQVFFTPCEKKKESTTAPFITLLSHRIRCEKKEWNRILEYFSSRSTKYTLGSPGVPVYLCAPFQILISLTDFQKTRYESNVTDGHANMRRGSGASTEHVTKMRNIVNNTKQSSP